jgi:hypothetical protein
MDEDAVNCMPWTKRPRRSAANEDAVDVSGHGRRCRGRSGHGRRCHGRTPMN